MEAQKAEQQNSEQQKRECQDIEQENREQEENKETLEGLFDHLEAVIRQMEEADTSLEESFELYNKGMTLLKKCTQTIDEVEKKVLVLDENGETHEF